MNRTTVKINAVVLFVASRQKALLIYVEQKLLASQDDIQTELTHFIAKTSNCAVRVTTRFGGHLNFLRCAQCTMKRQ